MLEAVNIFQTSNTGSANIYFSLPPSKASTVLKSSEVYKICNFSQFCVMFLLYKDMETQHYCGLLLF